MSEQLLFHVYLEPTMPLVKTVFSRMLSMGCEGVSIMDLSMDELHAGAFDAVDELSELLEGQDHEDIAEKAAEVAIFNLVIAHSVRLGSEKVVVK